tara:strand:- start:3326 stop:3577 length:252 start_codon:yes stop_codon:yes gene_type:complete
MPRVRTPKRKTGRVMKPRKSSKAKKKSSKSSSTDHSGILGYCMKCQAKKPFATSEIVIMKNGRKAKKGKCGDPNCDTTMFRIL